QTQTPAMIPMTTAAHGSTKAHGAVIATRPASKPLTEKPGSGFFSGLMTHMYIIAAQPPAAPASRVLTAANTARSRPAPLKESDEPGLKPNQPKNRMIVPSTPMAMLCPGVGLA